MLNDVSEWITFQKILPLSMLKADHREHDYFGFGKYARLSLRKRG